MIHYNDGSFVYIRTTLKITCLFIFENSLISKLKAISLYINKTDEIDDSVDDEYFLLNYYYYVNSVNKLTYKKFSYMKNIYFFLSSQHFSVTHKSGYTI